MEIKCSYTDMYPLEKLIPNPRNDNKHKVEHAKVLAKVFSARGVRHPIIVSKRSGFIVAGHLRLMAAEIAKMETYPVDIQEFENEAEEYKFLTSDNNISRYAEFDEGQFKINLQELEIEIEDFEEIGLIDFDLKVDLTESFDEGFDESNPDKKFVIKITFPNDMEMMDIHDDLVSRGYIVDIEK